MTQAVFPSSVPLLPYFPTGSRLSSYDDWAVLIWQVYSWFFVAKSGPWYQNNHPHPLHRSNPLQKKHSTLFASGSAQENSTRSIHRDQPLRLRHLLNFEYISVLWPRRPREWPPFLFLSCSAVAIGRGVDSHVPDTVQRICTKTNSCTLCFNSFPPKRSSDFSSDVFFSIACTI